MKKEAAEDGKTVVDIEAVKTAQKRYPSGMATEVKGYQLDTCFGPSGCPNRSVIFIQSIFISGDYCRSTPSY